MAEEPWGPFADEISDMEFLLVRGQDRVEDSVRVIDELVEVIVDGITHRRKGLGRDIERVLRRAVDDGVFIQISGGQMEDGYARLGLDVLNRMRGLHPDFYEAMAYAWLYHMSPRADEQPIEIIIDQPGEPGSLGDPPTPGGFYVLHYEDAAASGPAQQLFGDSMTMFPESSWHDFILEYLLAPSDQSVKAQVIEVIGDTLASYLDCAIYYSYEYGGNPFSVAHWHRAMAAIGYRFVDYDPYGAVINRNRR